jgi:hypothetical protein
MLVSLVHNGRRSLRLCASLVAWHYIYIRRSHNLFPVVYLGVYCFLVLLYELPEHACFIQVKKNKFERNKF